MSNSAVAGVVSGVVSFDKGAELIDESQVKARVDLGHSILYSLLHPAHGAIAVVSSAVGDSGVLAFA